jgi:hypothetical protein
MSIVIADDAVIGQLGATRAPQELRAPDGRLLGHFVPAVAGAENPALVPRISEEELQRRERAGGGRSLESILAELEKKP